MTSKRRPAKDEVQGAGHAAEAEDRASGPEREGHSLVVLAGVVERVFHADDAELGVGALPGNLLV